MHSNLGRYVLNRGLRIYSFLFWTQSTQTPRRERRSKRTCVIYARRCRAMTRCPFANKLKYFKNRAGMCDAARARGWGFAIEKAGFGNTHFQSGTDLVGGVNNEVGVVATFPARLRILRVFCDLCVLFLFYVTIIFLLSLFKNSSFAPTGQNNKFW